MRFYLILLLVITLTIGYVNSGCPVMPTTTAVPYTAFKIICKQVITEPPELVRAILKNAETRSQDDWDLLNAEKEQIRAKMLMLFPNLKGIVVELEAYDGVRKREVKVYPDEAFDNSVLVTQHIETNSSIASAIFKEMFQKANDAASSTGVLSDVTIDANCDGCDCSSISQDTLRSMPHRPYTMRYFIDGVPCTEHAF